ncbi:hypothetical protein MHYP_G00320030 [Metynnis hypsauchen]
MCVWLLRVYPHSDDNRHACGESSPLSSRSRTRVESVADRMWMNGACSCATFRDSPQLNSRLVGRRALDSLAVE